MITYECDVLVVGGGLAAVSAARAAAQAGASVCLAVKGSFAALGLRGSGASCCGTTFYGRPHLPGLGSAGYDADRQYRKIIAAGLGVADRRLARLLVEQAEEAGRTVSEWGVETGMKGPATLGYPFVSALEHRLRRSEVRILERIMVVDLLIQDDRCSGALAVGERGEPLVFQTPSVVLCTGGGAQLYLHNVHPDCLTGDGYAMALRAGAELMNMEFMQIFFMTVYPTRNLFHVWQGGELGEVRNREGRRFLADYLPTGISVEECLAENLRHAPFSTRDRASRYLGISLVKEIQAGRGSEHGGVFLDNPLFRTGKPRAQQEFLRYRGIEPGTMPLEITMGFQCSNGGIRIDERAMSAVPGVFAAGEAAAGMHGADRIGGHMLANCLIFGKRAGESAAAWARRHGPSMPEAGDRGIADHERRIRKLAGEGSAPDAHEELNGMWTALKQSAWNRALLVRSEQSLQGFLRELKDLGERYLGLRKSDVLPPIRALELENLLLVAEAVAVAARKRRESRGPHYREDYTDPEPADAVKAHILHLENGGVKVQSRVIDPDWREGDDEIGKGRWG